MPPRRPERLPISSCLSSPSLRVKGKGGGTDFRIPVVLTIRTFCPQAVTARPHSPPKQLGQHICQTQSSTPDIIETTRRRSRGILLKHLRQMTFRQLCNVSIA